MPDMSKHANPFPGLRPFEPDETHLFFGRDGQSREIIRRLERTRFLAVVGTSGSGKSSLVRAGLLPALRRGEMADAGAGWRVAIVRPGDNPIGNLAAQLASPEVFGSTDSTEAAMQRAFTEASLRRSSLGLLDVVRQARGSGGGAGRRSLLDFENVLILVDQFEELFRFRSLIEVENSKEDSAAFVSLLLEAAQQRGAPVYVVLTMRSDFLGDCAQFEGLPEAINDGQYLIPRMTRDERRAAVTGPVAVADARITEPLVNQLLNDMGDNPDQLPILQHALMRTFDYWRGARLDGEPIDLPHYKAIGGMSEALSQHAEEAYAELSESRRAIAEKLFKALTEKGADNRETRRPLAIGDACAVTEASEAEVVAVVETFRRPGRSFLMPPADRPLTHDSLLDISHESLIRNWARLKTWTEEEAQSARIYKRLGETAVLHRDGQEGLLKDPALQVALDWRERTRPNAAWARRYHTEFDTAMGFLDASVRERDAELLELKKRQRREVSYKRTRLAALFLALSFLLSLGASVYAYNSMSQAKASEANAVTALNQAKSALLLAETARQEATAARQDAEHRAQDAMASELDATEQLGQAEAAKAEADRRAAAAGESEQRANVALNDAQAALAAARVQSERNAQSADKFAAEAEETRQVLYPAAINLAQQAYEANDIERGREMLTLQTAITRSQPGFEWFYLWHLLNGEKDTLNVSTREDSLNVSTREVGVPVAVSGDGRLLAAASGRTVKLRALGGGAGSDFDVLLEGENFAASTVALSPDGKLLAVGNGEREGPAVKLFDVATRNEVAALKGDGRGTGTVIFTPDGKRLVKAGPRGVWLWDLSSAAEPVPFIAEQRNTSEPVVALSPDGKTLAARFQPNREAHEPEPPRSPLTLWDVASGTKVGELPAPARHAAFSRDGRLLVISHEREEVVSLWDVTTPRELFKVSPHPSYIRALALSPDAKLIAVGYFDGTLKLLKVGEDSVTPLTTLSGHGHGASHTVGQGKEITSLSFTADGRLLVSGGGDGTAKTWDIAALVAELTPLLVPTYPFTALAYSPDGRSLTAGGTVLRPPAAGAPATAERLEEQGEVNVSSAFSPDGRLLALGTTGWLRLLDAATRQPLGEPAPDAEGAYVVAFSPDGRLLAAGNKSGVVTVWDTSARGLQKVAEMKDSIHDIVVGLAFSNDGKRVAVRVSSVVSLWDVAKAEMVAQLPAYEGALPSAMAFSPTRPVLALGLSDGKVLLVDDRQLNPQTAARGHKSRVTSLAFTPDGRRIASGDDAGILKLRDAETLREMLTLDLKSGVQSLAFSPDGRTLATLGTSSKVMFWRAAAAAEVEAKTRAGGN